MFLLDTNVVSELRRAGSGKADAQVVTWAEKVPAQRLFLSTITILEIEVGILRLERKNSHRGSTLRSWLENQVLDAFAGRILPIDIPVAHQCAQLHTPDPKPERDALIAATALVHGLTVVTRNTSDFAAMVEKTINPWQA
ncbi:MAG: type II toxin-antitoxin system VapC family toxin [Acidobacteriota bacterium]|nr:type II toxin-antitoxin system VapC family toxin [Acidobacteriota bacterium]